MSSPAPSGPAPNDAPTSAPMDEGEGNLDALGRPIPTEDLFVKDAFLVFRALCKLSMKPLVTERSVVPAAVCLRTDAS